MATVNTTPIRTRPTTARAVATRQRARPPTTDRPLAAISCIDPGPEKPRKHMLAREQRTVNKAMDILGSYLRGPSPVFTTPQAVGQYICLHLGILPYEVFGVLFLDAQHRLIAFESMFRGTLTQTSVYPREVVIQALSHGAAAVVLTHNHPSGILVPSEADKALTQTLKSALSLVDVRVLDHFVVSGNGAVSMAELGLL